MLKRDYIMVMIEELGKVIAKMVFNRTEGDGRKNQELIQMVYTSLKTNHNQLMELEPEELYTIMNQEDGGGLQRMEIAVKTLLEERFLYPEQEEEIKNRALELLQFIQQKDNTFSLERANLIEELTKNGSY